MKRATYAQVSARLLVNNDSTVDSFTYEDQMYYYHIGDEASASRLIKEFHY